MLYLFTRFGYLLHLFFMKKKIYLALFTLFLSTVLFAQDSSELSAQSLFNDGKYSAAQAIINKNNS